MPNRPKMSPGESQFCKNAAEFRDWRGSIIDCRSVPLSERDHWRFHMLITSIIDHMRRHRPDLDTRTLYQLSCLDLSRLPPQGELAMLIDDASDLICETVHAIITGRVGEYIEAACPSLRKEVPGFNPNLDGWISFKEAVRLTALSPGWLSRLCARREIESTGVRRGKMINAASLARYMSEREAKNRKSTRG